MVGMETEPKQRDHRDEHEGCNAMWPWLQGCRQYWHVEGLIATATEDVKGLPAEERELWMRNVISQWKRFGAPSKWTLKSLYASHRDRWREDELQANLMMVELNAKCLGDEYLGGLTVEEKAEEEWALKIRRMAFEILVRYKAPIPPPPAD